MVPVSCQRSRPVGLRAIGLLFLAALLDATEAAPTGLAGLAAPAAAVHPTAAAGLAAPVAAVPPADPVRPAVPAAPANLVRVKGGSFKDIKSNYYETGVTVSDFYIGKYDVTQKEWVEVMGNNPS